MNSRRISWSNSFRNCDFSTLCSSRKIQLVFGASCETVGCSLDGTQITASRIVTSVPLNVSNVSDNSDVVELCPLEDPFGEHALDLYTATVREELDIFINVLMDLVSL